MKTTRRTILALAACAALLAACGSDSDDGAEETGASDMTSTTVEAPDDEGSAEGEPAGDGAGADGPGDPCARSEQAVADAFPDLEFGAPRPSTGERSIQDLEWSTVGCHWDAEVREVRVQVAGPEGFDGAFECAEPLSIGSLEVVPVSGVGEQAWWTWNDFRNRGEVSACAGELRVDVEVIGHEPDPITEDESRTAAEAIAAALLG